MVWPIAVALLLLVGCRQDDEEEGSAPAADGPSPFDAEPPDAGGTTDGHWLDTFIAPDAPGVDTVAHPDDGFITARDTPLVEVVTPRRDVPPIEEIGPPDPGPVEDVLEVVDVTEADQMCAVDGPPPDQDEGDMGNAPDDGTSCADEPEAELPTLTETNPVEGTMVEDVMVAETLVEPDGTTVVPDVSDTPSTPEDSGVGLDTTAPPDVPPTPSPKVCGIVSGIFAFSAPDMDAATLRNLLFPYIPGTNPDDPINLPTESVPIALTVIPVTPGKPAAFFSNLCDLQQTFPNAIPSCFQVQEPDSTCTEPSLCLDLGAIDHVEFHNNPPTVGEAPEYQWRLHAGDTILGGIKMRQITVYEPEEAIIITSAALLCMDPVACDPFAFPVDACLYNEASACQSPVFQCE